MFSRTPSPNRKSLKTERSPSPKSRNRLSPLFSRNSAPPSTGTGSSESIVNKSLYSPSSSPKLFDKSERTFNIPASLVFQHKEKAGKHLKTEGSLPNVEMIPPCTTNGDKNEIIKQSQLVTTRLSTSKPPIPAPRAINLPEVGSNEKSTSEGITNI